MQLVIGRPLCFMSKAELFKIPLFAWGLNRLGSFPVKRGEFDRQSILNASSVLESGLALMMFPEGTRTYGKGHGRGAQRHGAFRHAQSLPYRAGGHLRGGKHPEARFEKNHCRDHFLRSGPA